MFGLHPEISPGGNSGMGETLAEIAISPGLKNFISKYAMALNNLLRRSVEPGYNIYSLNKFG